MVVKKKILKKNIINKKGLKLIKEYDFEKQGRIASEIIFKLNKKITI